MEFELKGEYIELNKLLKVTYLVGTGGEANIRISEGEVLYNGQVDTRKRLKVRKGDLIEYNGTEIKVI